MKDEACPELVEGDEGRRQKAEGRRQKEDSMTAVGFAPGSPVLEYG
jgi:hypothetical protein